MPDMAKGYTFYAQVDRTELNKALHQIDFWDGKTRLKVEDAVSRGTKRVASDARRKVPRRTGTLRKSLKSHLPMISRIPSIYIEKIIA